MGNRLGLVCFRASLKTNIFVSWLVLEDLLLHCYFFWLALDSPHRLGVTGLLLVFERVLKQHDELVDWLALQIFCCGVMTLYRYSFSLACTEHMLLEYFSFLGPV